MRKIILGVLLILSLTLTSCSMFSSKPSPVMTNQNVLNVKDFYVSSTSTNLNTFARGTIFISGDNKPQRAKIVTWVEVDSQDWGGVILHLPLGWDVTSIETSYPEGQVPDFGGYQVALSTSGPAVRATDTKFGGYDKYVEIGTWHSSTPPENSGGKGTVVIEMQPGSKSPKPLEYFGIEVGVGSEVMNGTSIINPDSASFEIPLTTNLKSTP